MASLSLEHVSKRFGDVVAVHDLSLDIADGEFLAIVGPSGCGKTTVLRLIAGLEAPDSGTIRIAERVVNDVSAAERDVAMVFEDYALYPHLAVRDNLAFALRIRRTPAEEIRHRISAVSEAMELGHLLGRSPLGLAAGEAQHVAVSRAIVRDRPTVFLLDDALSHLDAQQRLEARAELARLHRELGSTIVSVTHDQAEALAIGTRVAVMNEGSLAQAGTPRELYERPVDTFVAGFIGSPPMNLIAMTIEGREGRHVLRSGPLPLPLELPLPLGRIPPEDDRVGRSVTVGIRPEHVRLGPAPAEEGAGARGRCELVEYMGHQVLAHLVVGGVALRAFDDPARHIRAGDDVDVTIALERIHLFDTETGRAMDLR
jgi:multiple sugar transport system ATP-binding protein